MKSLEKTALKLVARNSHGPFSYLTWPFKKRETVVSSHWVDGELILIEIPAPRFLENLERSAALAEVHNAINRLMGITLQLSLCELRSINEQLVKVLDSINLRYGRFAPEVNSDEAESENNPQRFPEREI